jgi:hypothetical protein
MVRASLGKVQPNATRSSSLVGHGSVHDVGARKLEKKTVEAEVGREAQGSPRESPGKPKSVGRRKGEGGFEGRKGRWGVQLDFSRSLCETMRSLSAKAGGKLLCSDWLVTMCLGSPPGWLHPGPPVPPWALLALFKFCFCCFQPMQHMLCNSNVATIHTNWQSSMGG